MTSWPLFAGMFAAMLHVIAGPDHLAAVVPLAIERTSKAWNVGLYWGLGHVCGMLLIGLLFLFFKDVIPVEEISGHSEQLVGIMLIFIALWVFYRILRRQLKDLRNQARPPKNTPSFFIGLLHGFAGVAHFIFFLPMLSFTSLTDGIVYLVGFALGTFFAMVSFTQVIGSISFVVDARRSARLTKGLQIMGGLFALVVGVYWVYQGS